MRTKPNHGMNISGVVFPRVHFCFQLGLSITDIQLPVEYAELITKQAR